MAKYVIDIPKETYNAINRSGSIADGLQYQDTVIAIQDATPLEKELDGIREELRNADETMYLGYNNGFTVYAIRTDKALEIIDKHIAESEDKE